MQERECPCRGHFVAVEDSTDSGRTYYGFLDEASGLGLVSHEALEGQFQNLTVIVTRESS